MAGNRRSCDMSKYCHFHEDHEHETNQFRELRHQIEEAMKSGQLAHLVTGIKKRKADTSDTQLGEWKKGDKEVSAIEALILMIHIGDPSLKRKNRGDALGIIEGINFPPYWDLSLLDSHAMNGNGGLYDLRSDQIPYSSWGRDGLL
ncbi:hypothetical protein Tco_0046515 [Tanacetum coccineum]